MNSLTKMKIGNILLLSVALIIIYMIAKKIMGQYKAGTQEKMSGDSGKESGFARFGKCKGKGVYCSERKPCPEGCECNRGLEAQGWCVEVSPIGKTEVS